MIVIETIVREFPVIVPVSCIVIDKPVNVPPGDNVNDFRFNAVVPKTNAVVPKSRVLNQLPVVSVAIDEPLVNVKFGLLVADPPAVLPN